MESSTPFESESAASRETAAGCESAADGETAAGSSAEIYDWISGFINMERGQSFKSFRLDRMKILSELTGHPETCAPAVHTAGSKGKGTVTGMIASILNAAGISCSVYASPHVMDFRERLSMGKFFFEETIYKAAGSELRRAVDLLVKSREPKYSLFDKDSENGEEPTFFELMTLWYFLCSRAANVKAMAVETGMGGRLDATNIVDPLASVITLIELEHTEYLGSTIAAIAGEKAGIIKRNRPVVLAAQQNDALEVFKKKAEETGSPLYYFPEYCEIKNLAVKKSGTTFSLKLKNPGNGKDLFYDELKLLLPGRIPAENAALALLAVKTAFPQIPDSAAVNGLAGFSLPARFERLPLKQDFVLDSAHTAASAQGTMAAFKQLYGSGGVLIFSCAASKDAAAMASIYIPNFSKIIITTPGTFKKSFPEEVYKTFKELASRNENTQQNAGHPEILFMPDTEKALCAALELGNKLRLPILSTGSFYLAGEVMSALKKHQEFFLTENDSQ